MNHEFSLREAFQKIEVQGHRGIRALRPENSLPSFLLAIEVGANVLELDVVATADNELIIHHDFFINKDLCSYLDGNPLLDSKLIRSLTLKEIKQIDNGCKVNIEFPLQQSIPGTQIPTLQEFFDCLHNDWHPNAKSIRLNLEIKRDPRFPNWTMSAPELALKILDQVKKNNCTDRVYYSSFDPEVLMEVRKLDFEACIGFIFGPDSLEIARLMKPGKEKQYLIEIASSLKAQVLSPDHVLLQSKSDVESLQQQGFKVVPWTVNDPKRWKDLIEMGVDGIITDNPKALVQWMKEEFP